MRIPTLKIAALLTLFALALSGCATYKPGTGASANTRTLWIAPGVNKSYMPQIATVVTERVRESFLQDSEDLIARREDADTRMDITITNLERDGRSSGLQVASAKDVNGVKTVTSVKDRGIDKAYDVIISARVVLTDSKTGAVLLDREFTTSSQSIVTPYALTNADQERMMMPILARDLARQIHDTVAHTWAEK